MFVKEVFNITSKIGLRKFHLQNEILWKNTSVATCGIIVTGDEILRGQILDTLSQFFCKKLLQMGIKVVKISKVPDNLDSISSEVKQFSKTYDYVLTTGGNGPTHDDVTYEAVAKAFDDKLVLNPDLSKLVFEFYGITDKNHSAFKMARIPSKAKLVYGFHPRIKPKNLVPCVTVENVFIFPGVEHYSQLMFETTKSKLFPVTGKFYNDNIYLKCSEAAIVDVLTIADKKFANVSFGSYPEFFNIYYQVKISLESINEKDLKEACGFLKTNILSEYQIIFDENPFENKRLKFEKFNHGVYKETFEFLSNLLREKQPKNIFLYFDGGKNSTALLHILSIIYAKHERINCFYVEINPKVTSFVFNMKNFYNINILKIDEDNFQDFAGCSKSIIVIKGTRNSDPDANKIYEHFTNINVLNPMANWRYCDVWNLIRGLCLPYCELYDKGYSSITKKNATRNPHLIKSNTTADSQKYINAFKLEDESLESAS